VTRSITLRYFGRRRLCLDLANLPLVSLGTRCGQMTTTVREWPPSIILPSNETWLKKLQRASRRALCVADPSDRLHFTLELGYLTRPQPTDPSDDEYQGQYTPPIQCVPCGATRIGRRGDESTGEWPEGLCFFQQGLGCVALCRLEFCDGVLF